MTDEPLTLKPMAQMWHEFQVATIPVDAGPDQRKLMRRAHYAGQTMALEQVTHLLDRILSGDEAEAAVELLRPYAEESHRFVAAMAAGDS